MNKQYSKEEYWDLVSRIKKDMQERPYIDANNRAYAYGDFFPIDFCPFGYDETLAHEFFPMKKMQAVERGFRWKDKEVNTHKPTIDMATIPDHIADVSNDILNEILECVESGRPYKITREELDFYKQMNIPLPRLHPDIRENKRVQRHRLPMTLYKRTTEDGVHVMTSYSPDRLEKIYSENGYNDLIL